MVASDETEPGYGTSSDAGADEPSERSIRLMTALKLARELLPGDSRYGDPLSTAGAEPRQLAGRRLGELASERPGVLKEAGLSALQVWEAVSQSAGRQRGGAEKVIAFTDLVGFSDWALKAGDDAAVELLRDVGRAIEPPVTARAGVVVKRLGDGMMAAFNESNDAAEAIFDAFDRLAAVEGAGYRPRMRAGLHVGEPKRLGEDFFGVDVNVAARVADAASAGELLVSGAMLEALDTDEYSSRKKLLFRAKGVPSDIAVYSLKRRRGR
jgi:adenylate cyclase